MKKIIAIVFAIIALIGCAKKETPETVFEKTVGNWVNTSEEFDMHNVSYKIVKVRVDTLFNYPWNDMKIMTLADSLYIADWACKFSKYYYEFYRGLGLTDSANEEKREMDEALYTCLDIFDEIKEREKNYDGKFIGWLIKYGYTITDNGKEEYQTAVFHVNKNFTEIISGQWGCDSVVDDYNESIGRAKTIISNTEYNELIFPENFQH